jgi:catechol 2,3-dioxygenase-like lactoylglutathione lyase family enzyme
MARSPLSLLVLRTGDLERSLRFYRALGLRFIEEQHGNGPRHYACSLGGDAVLELYPGQPGSAPERRFAGATMLGFRVDVLSQTMCALAQLDVVVLTAPGSSSVPSRAVVQDPDGRAVELTEA